MKLSDPKIEKIGNTNGKEVQHMEQQLNQFQKTLEQQLDPFPNLHEDEAITNELSV